MFVLFLYGGEEEIRTLEPLLTVTRFPVVRPRPTRRLLHGRRRSTWRHGLVYHTFRKKASGFCKKTPQSLEFSSITRKTVLKRTGKPEGSPVEFNVYRNRNYPDCLRQVPIRQVLRGKADRIPRRETPSCGRDCRDRLHPAPHTLCPERSNPRL